ncbi:MAG: alanine--tRNA ligase [Salibacteraceae bacterium]
MHWTSNKIRSEFLEFFKGKGHKIVSSAPMVLKDDPTLMFTNAGMNQFKDVFLGINKPDSVRVVDTQKCLRVSGKHNDLEEVGVDTYHHTMFEMLGNWSFGDYFKKEAIDWAWELLTEVYKIDKDRLYITVFEGEKSDNLKADTEAEDIWKTHIASERILRCDKKDNFWEMGVSGPCGPCSEIHVDIRPIEDRDKVDGLSLVNQDHPMVIEIWNLVFMEFNRKANGSLEHLPQKHVDTGMGLERLTVVLQEQQSNYDTDVFSGLIAELEKISSKTYTKSDSKTDVAFRVISDHVRAVSFSIADGQLPSNTGAGYVIRRILRRGIRYGYSFLDLNESFIHQLVNTLVDGMGNSFPELKAQKGLIAKVIKEEEESFLRTLSKGISRLESLISDNGSVSGKQAFELYDTFGFPIDLTQLIALERNVNVDIKEFDQELKIQKDRSRSSNITKTNDWVVINENQDVLGFNGYDQTKLETQIVKYREVSEKGKTYYQLVLYQTPFYPEGGGQVGDTGFVEQNGSKISIIETQKENDLIVHKAKSLPEELKGVWNAVVNSKNRKLSAANHSATHLLHFVLREVLGTHVEQKGSLVNPKYLRFDFSHYEKIDSDALTIIENRVNQLIADGISLNEHRNIPINEAKEKGAMSLFGEKYGDKVRMIEFGDSKELCGGTHVENTSEIKRFVILNESSVAAGIRRIEAITSDEVFTWYDNQVKELNLIKTELKNPKDVLKAVNSLIEEGKELKGEVEKFEKAQILQIKESLQSDLKVINGINVISGIVPISAKGIKDIAFQLKNEIDNLLLVVGSTHNNKAGLTIAISDSLVDSKSLNANQFIKECSSLIQGGGGGQAFFATAGGQNPDGLTQAIDLVISKV